MSVVTSTRSLGGRALADLMQQVVHLALDGTDLYLRIDQAGGADDLLHDHAAALGQLIRAGSGADENDLVDARLELLEGQRAVIERRRQAEAEVNQVLLAGAVAVPHAAHLRNCLVALVHEEEKIAWK